MSQEIRVKNCHECPFLDTKRFCCLLPGTKGLNKKELAATPRSCPLPIHVRKR